MEKSGRCVCGTLIRVPTSECLYQCKKCNAKGIFLCHIIPNSGDPVMVRCKECKIAYSMFECPQCTGTGVIKGFLSGHVYGCVCGFTATFVSCNICTALLCLPPSHSYENSVIQCKKCQNRFQYRVCSACGESNYMTAEQAPLTFETCFNENCKYFNRKEGKNTMDNVSPSKEEFAKKDSKCKICLNKEATMINSSCFHLCVCQLCVDQLSLDRCPICKAKGQYRKVVPA